MTPRKELRTKVKRLRGRVNTLRTALTQLEPKYLKLVEQLQKTEPKQKGESNNATSMEQAE
jgi:hypothetical protein